MTDRRRAVITGIGAVTPIGCGRDGLWKGVLAGRSAVRTVRRFDAVTFRSRLAAEVEGFSPGSYSGTRARRLDRFAAYGLAAATQALEDAGLEIDPSGPRLVDVAPERVSVSLGSALGGVAYGEEQHSAYLEAGLRAVGPTLAIAVYGGASGAHIAIEVGAHGPNLAISSSCASGAIAIGEALRLIRREEADLVLAGGAEAPLAPLTFGAFSLIKAMSGRNDDPGTASRPFDVERDGFVMGEGAAVILVEERDRARRRGARIYAELMGYAQTNDAYHMTAPRPDGGDAARAVSLALSDACIQPANVGYVNAHATGTVLGDRAEACALRNALGRHADNVPVSGTKGLYGHALGASGAIEAAITALAIHEAFLPGTANLGVTEPGCPICVLPSEGTRESVGAALSTSFGFGGVNCALVLGAA